jgi:hypothetical protein
MPDRTAQDAWIKQALGIDVPGASPSAQRGEEARAANTRGIAYPKMLLRWRQAQSDAVNAVNRIGQAYLGQSNVQADPRYAEVQSAVAELPGLIPQLGEQLSDLLDRGINEGSDAGIAKDAIAVIGLYRSNIAGATQLSAFEQFAKKYVGELAVIGMLDGALAEIADNLKPATSA